MRFVLKLSAAVLLAFTAGVEADEEKRFSFETAEKLYNSGKCDSSIENVGVSHREMTLIFLNDVLGGVVERKSIAHDMVGNMSIFKIGRRVDPVLTRLYDYAERADVRQQIAKDIDMMNGEVERLVKNDALTKESYFLFVCEEYKMLTGQNYYFADALNEYSNDLNKRIYHRNMDNLQNRIDEGE